MRLFLALLTALPTILPAALTAGPAPEGRAFSPTANAILARALDCARRAHREAVAARYRALHTNRTLAIGASGKVSNSDMDVYRVRPAEGRPYYELIERNGRPPTPGDLRWEEKRRREFRESFDSEADLARETGVGFALTQALLDRYEFELQGLHPDYGWVLRFAPMPGNLPVRRRIDEVLNRLEGTLWVDAEDFGLRRAEFALREPLKIWAGLLGTLTRFEGRFEQIRLAPGHWLPREMKIEMDGWSPFRSLRRRVELDWTEYEPAR